MSNRPSRDPKAAWTRVTRIGGLLAAGLGALALTGWMSGLEFLATFGGGHIPMAPSTALLFLVFGTLSVVHSTAGLSDARARRLAQLLGTAATVVAAILLVFFFLDIRSSVEYLGMDISGRAGAVLVGHMSPLTAMAFILAGLALVIDISAGDNPTASRAAFFAAILLEILAVILIAAYVVSQPLLYGTGIIPPALTTSLGFGALGLALAASSARGVWPAGAASSRLQPNPGYGVVVGLFVAAGIVIAGATVLFGRYQADFRGETELHISAVADLKVSQIASWRSELLADARAVFGNPEFAALAGRAVNERDPGAMASVRGWMEGYSRSFFSPRITLHLPDGSAALSVEAAGAVAPDAPHPAADIRRTLEEGQIVLEGFHRDTPDGPVHLTVLTPIADERGGGVAVMAIRVDPEVFLFPMLQQWPTPSRTAETLLVRRDGDEVVFLNRLRFLDNAPLDLRHPVTDSTLPAVQAVLGVEGIVEGTDYRGEPVVAAVRMISGSPWRLVARIDKSEIYGPLRERLRVTVMVVSLLLLGMTGSVAFVWQRREKLHYRSVLETEERQGAVLRSIGDAVIATDARGIVVIMNPVAEALTGWTEEEARGRPLRDVFHIINEDTRGRVGDPVQKVLDTDGIGGLADSTVLVARDGTERPIADSGAPVRGPGGAITGVVLVFRDQTAERNARRGLAAREAKYRNLFDSIRDAIVVAGTDRTIIDCNPAFTELFGYEPDEIRGAVTSVVYESQEEFEEMGARLRESMDDPGVFHTIQYRRKDGTVFPGDTTAFYLRDGSGEVRGFIGLIRDVSLQEEAERALEASERRYRMLYEAAPVGIFRTDSNGEALAINQAMARILGFMNADAAIEHYSDLRNELYADPVRRDQFLQLLREQGQVDQFEYEAVTVTGARRWIEMNARLAAHRPDGSFEIEGFATDITERKAAERELQDQQTMLARTEAMAHLGSWELDVQTGEVTWSDELFRIFQLDPAEGAPDLGENGRLLPPEDLERLRGAIDRAIENGESYDMEIRAVRSDGSIRICRTQGYPQVEIDGSVSRLFGSFQDITDRRDREEREAELRAQLAQAQKMESVGRLAGGVAHDFNNMLSVILGHAELALESLDGQNELREELQAIHDAAKRSADLTGQLLAFAREQIAAPKVLDLNETVRSMLKMLKRVIGEDVELVWSPADTVWPIRIDPVQVDQILANLLVNARDALAGVGAVTIETTTATIDEAYAATHADARAGEFVTLVVSDNGCGMPTDVVERIFEPFFSTKPQGEGTGLGLATVYGIIRQNGGFINVYSEVAEGTTFRIYLPRHTGVVEPTGEREGQVIPEGGNETILVVEDQPALLGLARKILEGRGYRVLAAEDPEEALELARGEGGGIHLLLTDVVMPNMNGRELEERLRAEQPDLRTLFMSGYPSDVIADRGVLQEGVRFIEKPFTVAELSASVRSALDED